MSSSDVFTPLVCSSSLSRGEWIAYLRREMESISHRMGSRPQEGVSTGMPQLDALLPGKKVFSGGLVEWIADHEGTGAETLSLQMAWHVVGRRQYLVIVDQTQEIYPPGLVYLGIDLERTLFLHPASEKDAFWAICQALRCPKVGSLWARIDRLDTRTARRFRLAAEQGGTFGVFVRPGRALREISWADVRFWVQPEVWRVVEDASQRRWVKVTVLRAKGQWTQTAGEVVIDDPADPVSCTFPVLSFFRSTVRDPELLRA